MKITIEIPDRIAKILSEWASVQRTLNTAIEGLETNETKDDRLKEKFEFCITELDIIGPALDALHQTVRSEIWYNKDNKEHIK